jgi:hypothetical protein
MQLAEIFEPSEVWASDSNNPALTEAIEKTRLEMNQKNPDQLINTLKKEVKHSDSGIVYAVLKGEHPEEYSDTDALVMFNPFANTATPNMLVRSEFIREVARFSNIRDEEGKLKPLIMLASPGLHGSRLTLNHEDKKRIRKGNLGPAAKEYMETVAAINFGRVALLGFSQGADMAVAGARSAYSANLDTQSLSIGDPASVTNRSPYVLAKDFGAASPDLEKEASAIGLPVLDNARHASGEYRRFALSALFPLNWSLLGRSLGHNSFEVQMEELLKGDTVDRAVVGYGANSTISPPGILEPSLAKLHQQFDHNKLVTIRVQDKGHAWGDNLSLLAKLYLKAMV